PEGVRGSELIRRMRKQCERFGVEIRELERALRVKVNGDERVVETERSSYGAEAVIIASGSRHRTLNVPGERRLLGLGVSYCALCDGAFFKGRRVLVVGGGNTAAVSALYLADLASETFLVHRRNQLRAEGIYIDQMRGKGVKLILNSEVKEIRGESRVEGVVILDKGTGELRELNVDGVFIAVGEVPNSDVARESGIELDDEGYIIVDRRQRTNIPGVYAAGDVTNSPVKQIGTAVGQAIVAAVEAYGYVRRPYYYRNF
ncbi:thioredoxin-disulfide reductase, partial [Candidatus Bathyarchaeota archaeon]